MLLRNDLLRLREFIQERIGIFIDNEKLENVYKKKFEEFMKQHRFEDFMTFFLALQKDRTLYQELVNLVTVNETYFFREKYQFETLVEEVIPELDRKKYESEPIAILSAPTSSGEELYSIAIYISEYNKEILQRRDFYLVGIDIDTHMIEKAQRGVYSQRSVSKIPPNILQKYFTFDNEGYKIDDSLRSAITFKVVNVFNVYEMKRLGKFDVIFSRNMLIYFDDKKRREVLATFYSLLREGGYLFLGHAEKVPEDMEMFERVRFAKSIAYRKVG